MNRIFVLLMLLSACIVARAANPSLENFNQTHFRTNGPIPGIIQTRLSSSNFDQSGNNWTITNIGTATGGTLWTNDTSIGGGAFGRLTFLPNLPTRYLYPTNFYGNGWFGLEPEFKLLSLGNNVLTTDDDSSWFLLSPDSDPSLVTIELEAGTAVGQELVLMSYTNTPFNGRFTLPANSSVSGVGVVKLQFNQDWVGENGAVLKLQWLPPDWWEQGRWTAGTTNVTNVFETLTINNAVTVQNFVTIGGNQVGTINPTNLRLPVRSGTNSFADSAISMPAIGSTNVIVDGQIIWGSGLTNVLQREGESLVYTNGAAQTFFKVRDGQGATASLGVTTGDHVLLLGGVGSDVFIGANNNGSGDLVINAATTAPTSDGAMDLGGPSARYKDLYITGTITGGSAANWTAEGTTNSTLAGTLRANSGVLTNGGTFGASTFTGSVSGILGAVGTPSFTGPDADSGMYFFSSGASMGFSRNSTAYLLIGNTVDIPNGVQLGFESTVTGTATTVISQDGANVNTLQIGTDSATATAQTFKGSDGVGTDKVGGALQLGGGKGTGTAAGGSFILYRANSAGGSSSTVNTYSEFFHAPAKWVDLTESTATTIYALPVPATNYVGFTATVTVYATDGTDHQSKTSVVTVDAIAKTTVITPTVSQVDNTTAASAGTLTCTYTVVDDGSNVLSLKADAASSLSQTVLRAKLVLTAVNSNGTAAGSEQ